MDADGWHCRRNQRFLSTRKVVHDDDGSERLSGGSVRPIAIYEARTVGADALEILHGPISGNDTPARQSGRKAEPHLSRSSDQLRYPI